MKDNVDWSSRWYIPQNRSGGTDNGVRDSPTTFFFFFNSKECSGVIRNRFEYISSHLIYIY
jgi:hypothetical protein